VLPAKNYFSPIPLVPQETAVPEAPPVPHDTAVPEAPPVPHDTALPQIALLPHTALAFHIVLPLCTTDDPQTAFVDQPVEEFHSSENGIIREPVAVKGEYSTEGDAALLEATS
jgi:hypothetical protein